LTTQRAVCRGNAVKVVEQQKGEERVQQHKKRNLLLIRKNVYHIVTSKPGGIHII